MSRNPQDQFDLDDIDRQIVSALQHDGRRPYSLAGRGHRHR